MRGPYAGRKVKMRILWFEGATKSGTSERCRRTMAANLTFQLLCLLFAATMSDEIYTHT